MEKEKKIHFLSPPFFILARWPFSFIHASPARLSPLLTAMASIARPSKAPAHSGELATTAVPSPFSLPLMAWARMSAPSPISRIAHGQAATVARAHFASWERLPRTPASTKGGPDPSLPSLLPPSLHFCTRRAHRSRNHRCSLDPPKLGEPPRGPSSLGSLRRHFSSAVRPPGFPPSPRAFSFVTLGL